MCIKNNIAELACYKMWTVENVTFASVKTRLKTENGCFTLANVESSYGIEELG